MGLLITIQPRISPMYIPMGITMLPLHLAIFRNPDKDLTFGDSGSRPRLRSRAVKACLKTAKSEQGAP